MITWEAHHTDGFVLKELEGALYRQIDRSQLMTFRFVQGHQPLLELHVTDGRSGWNLVYRRRTIMGQSGGKRVIYLAGFIPQGPVIGLSEDLTFERREFFTPGDPIFSPPVPIEEEGEQLPATFRRPS